MADTYNNPDVEELVAKISNGEFNSDAELKRALKLIRNAAGTAVEEKKEAFRQAIEYATCKKEIDGVEYMPVNAIMDYITLFL